MFRDNSTYKLQGAPKVWDWLVIYKNIKTLDLQFFKKKFVKLKWYLHFFSALTIFFLYFETPSIFKTTIILSDYEIHNF